MTPFIANMIVHSQYLPAIGLLTVAGVTDLVSYLLIKPTLEKATRSLTVYCCWFLA